MQEDSGTGFIEEIKDAVTSLPQSQPGLSELAFDLRGVREIERRAACLEQVDPRQDFASNLLRYAVELDA